MPYLKDYEIERAAGCVNNIQDKLDAIKTELSTREKPYKSYLKEKLDSILWDTKVMISMCESEGEE